MEYAVYRKSTGEILWFVCSPPDCVLDQCTDDDIEIFLNCPKDAVRIVDNTPVS